MATLFTLFGRIAIDSDLATSAIAETTQAARTASDGLKSSFEKIGSAAITCGKAIASGLAVGATALGALTKAVIGEYADYEQLVGGVETLFESSSGKVIEYATMGGK